MAFSSKWLTILKSIRTHIINTKSKHICRRLCVKDWERGMTETLRKCCFFPSFGSMVTYVSREKTKIAKGKTFSKLQKYIMRYTRSVDVTIFSYGTHIHTTNFTIEHTWLRVFWMKVVFRVWGNGGKKEWSSKLENLHWHLSQIINNRKTEKKGKKLSCSSLFYFV